MGTISRRKSNNLRRCHPKVKRLTYRVKRIQPQNLSARKNSIFPRLPPQRATTHHNCTQQLYARRMLLEAVRNRAPKSLERHKTVAVRCSF